jgi:hypothetical protein
MSEQPIIANPIGWGQVRLLGGWKRLWGFVAGYTALWIVALVIIYRALRPEHVSLSAFADGASKVMMFVQAGVVLLGGLAAIKKAIQRDFTTGMIASHRTASMTGHTAVLGYLTGATVQVLLIALANWAIGTVLALLAGVTTTPFAPSILLAVLGCMAAMFWTLGVLAGLGSRGTAPIAPLIVILWVFASIRVLGLVPGLSLLAYTGALPSFGAGLPTPSTGAFVLVSMAAQLLFAAVFFVAAARKFARDDVPAFTLSHAYILLALCALLAAAGLCFSGLLAPSWLPSGISEPAHQLVATLVALVLAAFVPISVAAKSVVQWTKRSAKDPGFREARPRHYLEAPLTATFLVFAILVATLSAHADRLIGSAGRHELAYYFGWSAGPFLLTLVVVAGFLRLVYSYTDKSYLIVTLLIFFTWAAPPLVDLALEVGLDLRPDEPRSAILAFSPIGAWLIVFKGLDAPLVPGAVFQALLAVGGVLLARRARR